MIDIQIRFNEDSCRSMPFFPTGLESLSVDFRDPNPTRPPMVRMSHVLNKYAPKPFWSNGCKVYLVIVLLGTEHFLM